MDWVISSSTRECFWGCNSSFVYTNMIAYRTSIEDHSWSTIFLRLKGNEKDGIFSSLLSFLRGIKPSFAIFEYTYIAHIRD
jgi:hypothetical protein